MEHKLLLDEMLDLINSVNRINRDLVQSESRGRLGNLSGIQLHAIITIRRCGVVNMSDLADRLLVTRPQMTKVVDALAEMGYLTRETNPDSRREVLLRLTDQGKQYIEESLLGPQSVLARVLASAGPEEIDALREAIRTMRRVFSKVEGER